MTLMRSPGGDEREIKPAGVAALVALGWSAVKQDKTPAKKAASGKTKK